MKNQLFRISPDFKFSTKVLNLFGISDFNDNHSFTKFNLKELDTVNKMGEIVEELKKYYLPCKSKLYLLSLNEKKCITILRQLLKVHNYTLMSKEKYIKGKKSLFYQVIPLQIDMTIKERNSKVIIRFD
tara:strand:+ start:101 stop:487 length:387 start_codon:yes stop_codon:yes gene_type:complete